MVRGWAEMLRRLPLSVNSYCLSRRPCVNGRPARKSARRFQGAYFRKTATPLQLSGETDQVPAPSPLAFASASFRNVTDLPDSLLTENVQSPGKTPTTA